MNQGIVYVATGPKYFDEAAISATSVKILMPAMPITIFTDQIIMQSCFDQLIPIKSCGDGFKDKVINMARSPYDCTLFLDTDTYVCGNIKEMFDLLLNFDLALAHDHLVRQVYPMAGVPTCFPEFNSGVFLFRKTSEVVNFFDNWLDFFEKDKINVSQAQGVLLAKGHPDQPSLRRTLYFSNLRIATLTTEYNCMFRYTGSVSGEVKILHAARMGYGWYRRGNLEHVATTLNTVLKARVFISGRLYAFLRTPQSFLTRINPFVDVYSMKFVGWLFAPDWIRRLQHIPRLLQTRGFIGTGIHGVRRLLRRWCR